MASASEQALASRIDVIESWKNANKLPTTDGTGEGNLAKTVLDMEVYVSTLDKRSTNEEIRDR